MLSCFLFGHRNAPEEIESALQIAVERCIRLYDVRSFYVGRYGSFDSMAARAVICAKKTYPDIMLSMLLPYHPAERPIQVPLDFDSAFYPPGMQSVPRRFAILQANQYMLRKTDSVICYANHIGNARSLYELALKRKERDGIYVQNLAQMDVLPSDNRVCCGGVCGLRE